MSFSGFFPTRFGEYVYDVTVSETTDRLESERFCASISHVERLVDDKLQVVPADVIAAYGATVEKARARGDWAMQQWITERAERGSAEAAELCG